VHALQLDGLLTSKSVAQAGSASRSRPTQQKRRSRKPPVSDRLISLPSDHRRTGVFPSPLSSLSDHVQKRKPQPANVTQTALTEDDPASCLKDLETLVQRPRIPKVVKSPLNRGAWRSRPERQALEASIAELPHHR